MGIARNTAAIVGGLAIGALSMAPAHAGVINTFFNAPLTNTPLTFVLGGGVGSVSFTAAMVDDGPGAAVATTNGVQVTSINLFGLQVADYFPGTVFDGTASFSSFSMPAPIEFSAADDFIGLAYTAADGQHLGYAEVFGSNLIGIAYQTTPGASITGVSLVPEPASIALLMSGLGVAGLVRRKRRSSVQDAVAA